ncbi:MAG TPA: hypothetical protein VN721_03005, partial [Flavipsychrobacter sp.]|nr:hypothetical protein [Flavipsychrobacter sp.]
TSLITVPALSTLSYTVSTAPWMIPPGTPFDFNFMGILTSGKTIKIKDPSSCVGFPTNAPWTDCTPTGTVTWTNAPTSPPAPVPTTATVTFN